jgi:hypothetical protein
MLTEKKIQEAILDFSYVTSCTARKKEPIFIYVPVLTELEEVS